MAGDVIGTATVEVFPVASGFQAAAKKQIEAALKAAEKSALTGASGTRNNSRAAKALTNALFPTNKDIEARGESAGKAAGRGFRRGLKAESKKGEHLALKSMFPSKADVKAEATKLGAAAGQSFRTAMRASAGGAMPASALFPSQKAVNKAAKAAAAGAAAAGAAASQTAKPFGPLPPTSREAARYFEAQQKAADKARKKAADAQARADQKVRDADRKRIKGLEKDISKSLRRADVLAKAAGYSYGEEFSKASSRGFRLGEGAFAQAAISSSNRVQQKVRRGFRKQAWGGILQPEAIASQRTLARGLNSAGRSLTWSASGAAGLTLGLAGYMGASFESAISRAASVVPGSVDSQQIQSKWMAEFSKKAKEVSGETIFNPNEAAQGLEALTKGGLSAQEAIDSLDTTVNLAVVGDLPLEEASKIAAIGLNVFDDQMKSSGDTTEEFMNRVGDSIATAANRSQAGVANIADSFTYAASNAATLGFSVEETSAAIGVLSKGGLIGSKGGTALNSFLSSLVKAQKEGTAANKAFKDYKFDPFTDTGDIKSMTEITQDLAATIDGMSKRDANRVLKELFPDERAGRGARLLAKAGKDGADSFEEMFKAINKGKGSLDRLEELSMGKTARSFEEMKGALEEMMIAIGDVIAPDIQSAADAIQGLADKIAAADPGKLRAVAKALGAIALAGPGLWVTGAAMRAINTAMAGASALAFVAGGGGAGKGLGRILGKRKRQARKEREEAEALQPEITALDAALVGMLGLQATGDAATVAAAIKKRVGKNKKIELSDDARRLIGLGEKGDDAARNASKAAKGIDGVAKSTSKVGEAAGRAGGRYGVLSRIIARVKDPVGIGKTVDTGLAKSFNNQAQLAKLTQGVGGALRTGLKLLKFGGITTAVAVAIEGGFSMFENSDGGSIAGKLFPDSVGDGLADKFSQIGKSIKNDFLVAGDEGFLKGIATSFGDVGSSLSGLWNSVVAVLGPLPGWFNSWMGFLGDIFAAAIPAIDTGLDAFDSLQGAIDAAALGLAKFNRMILDLWGVNPTQEEVDAADRTIADIEFRGTTRNLKREIETIKEQAAREGRALQIPVSFDPGGNRVLRDADGKEINDRYFGFEKGKGGKLFRVPLAPYVDKDGATQFYRDISDSAPERVELIPGGALGYTKKQIKDLLKGIEDGEYEIQIIPNVKRKPAGKPDDEPTTYNKEAWDEYLGKGKGGKKDPVIVPWEYEKGKGKGVPYDPNTPPQEVPQTAKPDSSVTDPEPAEQDVTFNADPTDISSIDPGKAEAKIKLSISNPNVVENQIAKKNVRVPVTLALRGKGKLDNLGDKPVSVTATVDGTEEVNALAAAIRTVKPKPVTVEATVNGLEEVQALVFWIAAVQSKSVTITTRYVDIKETRTEDSASPSPSPSDDSTPKPGKNSSRKDKAKASGARSLAGLSDKRRKEYVKAARAALRAGKSQKEAYEIADRAITRTTRAVKDNEEKTKKANGKVGDLLDQAKKFNNLIKRLGVSGITGGLKAFNKASKKLGDKAQEKFDKQFDKIKQKAEKRRDELKATFDALKDAVAAGEGDYRFASRADSDSVADIVPDLLDAAIVEKATKKQRRAITNMANSVEPALKNLSARLKQIELGEELRDSLVASGPTDWIDWSKNLNVNDLLTTLRSVTPYMATFGSDMKQLRANGAPVALLQQIAEMDPKQAAVLARSLVTDPGAAAEVFAAYGEFDNVIKSVADSAAGAAFAESGQDAAEGFAAGMKSKEGVLRKEIKKIANILVNTFKKAMGIKSPSKRMAKQAKRVIDGLAKGLKSTSKLRKAKKAVRKNANSVLSAVSGKQAKKAAKKTKKSLKKYYKYVAKAKKRAAENVPADPYAYTPTGAGGQASAEDTEEYFDEGLTEAEKTEKRAEKISETVRSTFDGLTGSIDMSKVFAPGQLKREMDRNAKYMRETLANREALKGKGLSDAVLNQIKDMDPRAAARFTQRLLNTPGMIAELNASQAGFEKAGTDLATGIGEGILKEDFRLNKIMEGIGEGLVDALKDYLEIDSPSKVFEDQGRAISDGIRVGVLGGKSDIEQAITSVVPVPNLANWDLAARDASVDLVSNELGAGVGGTVVNVDVHPSAGMDEADLAAAVGRELSWRL